MKQLKSIEQYNEQTKSEKTVFVFWADWCPDCQVIKPFLPELEKDFEEINFIQVDRDEFLDLAKEHDVYGIPSFLAFDNGIEVARFVSPDRKSREEIEDFLEKVS